MFEMIQNIGSIISNIGTFFATVWDSIKSLFSFIASIFSTILAILGGFPLWLATIITFTCVCCIILWLTFNR